MLANFGVRIILSPAWQGIEGKHRPLLGRAWSKTPTFARQGIEGKHRILLGRT